MPTKKVIIEGKEVHINYSLPPRLPLAWVELLNKLHPVTAVVVWEVLTDSLTPLTITLAQTSPDWSNYTAIRIVGGGNPNYCKDVAALARDAIAPIFEDLLGYGPQNDAAKS